MLVSTTEDPEWSRPNLESNGRESGTDDAVLDSTEQHQLLLNTYNARLLTSADKACY